jgi:hypothetical protein
MSHTADVAQAHDTHAVEVERMEKEVVHIPPNEGARSLWVMDLLVTYKIQATKLAGPTPSSRWPPSQGPGLRRTSTTARTSPSTCSQGSTSS